MHEPINGTCYYSEESNDDDDDDDFVIPNNDFDDYDEYVLEMLYDNARDDSPIFLIILFFNNCY
jgi:carboxypeptidase C (cathepsin A)